MRLMKTQFFKPALFLALVMAAPLAHATTCEVTCLGNTQLYDLTMSKISFTGTDHLTPKELYEVSPDGSSVAHGQRVYSLWLEGSGKKDITDREEQACKERGMTMQLASTIPVGELKCGQAAAEE